MSPQSGKETRQQVGERSEQLIQESRQLVEAVQAAMWARDSRKHRDTLGEARERTFQANTNPPPDPISTILSKPPTGTNFFGQCGILLKRRAPKSARLVGRG